MRRRGPLRRVGRSRPGVALESGAQSTASRSSVHGQPGALDADTDRSLCAAVICPFRNLLAAFRYHREELPDLTQVDSNGIIEQILRRGRQAYAQLIARYQDSVFASLWRMGLRRSVIEELAQKTFARARTNLGNFQPTRSAFSTWLFAIGRNLALNEIGRAGHRLEVAADNNAELASCEDNPPAALARKRYRARLHAGLGRVATAQRSVPALCAALAAPQHLLIHGPARQVRALSPDSRGRELPFALADVQEAPRPIAFAGR